MGNAIQFGPSPKCTISIKRKRIFFRPIETVSDQKEGSWVPGQKDPRYITTVDRYIPIDNFEYTGKSMCENLKKKDPNVRPLKMKNKRILKKHG